MDRKDDKDSEKFKRKINLYRKCTACKVVKIEGNLLENKGKLCVG